MLVVGKWRGRGFTEIKEELYETLDVLFLVFIFFYMQVVEIEWIWKRNILMRQETTGLQL